VRVGGRGVIVGGRGDAVADGWGVFEGVFDGVRGISLDSKSVFERVNRANPPAVISAVIQRSNTILKRFLRVDITSWFMGPQNGRIVNGLDYLIQ
jgi:hypothetical protein